MRFNKLNEVRCGFPGADKSAMGAINRPLRMVGILLKVIIGLYTGHASVT